MKVSAFSGYSWPTHINEMYVCVLGIPKCKFSKQMIKKYLATEYLFITEEKFLFEGLSKYVICRCFVCLHSVVTVISQRESHRNSQTCVKYRVVEYYRVCRFRDVILEFLLKFQNCVA